MAETHPLRRRGIKWSLLRIAIMLVTAMLILQGCVMLFEERFIYFPTKYPDGDYDLAQLKYSHMPGIEDVWLTTADGVRIHGWYCTPAPPEKPADATVAAAAADDESDRQVVLMFHGNAGNLTHRYELIELFTDLGRDFFIIDYRGYGRSEGSPSEQGLYHDARAAWDFLANDRGVAPGRIILMGKSLGAAPATELATHVEPGGLIIEAAFTSAPDMARIMMPLLPTFTLSHKLDSLGRVGRINCPKLFTHSPTDEMIPYEHGRRLFDAAAEPKWFYDVQDAGHNTMQAIGGAGYRQAVSDFLDRCEQTRRQKRAVEAAD
jgi:hypothetical protein